MRHMPVQAPKGTKYWCVLPHSEPEVHTRVKFLGEVSQNADQQLSKLEDEGEGRRKGVLCGGDKNVLKLNVGPGAQFREFIQNH